MASLTLRAFSDLWDAARARLAAKGSNLTLTRVQRETGVPVATLSDWRTGAHAPRDADRFLSVVRLLSRWAELPPPNVREWLHLVEQRSEIRSVKDSSTTSESPLWTTSIVGLAERLSLAFSAKHVSVDALCLTGQSLALAAARPVQDIHAGKIRPETVSIRVLLPSRDIPLAFPASVTAPQVDDPVHQRWLSRRNTHAQSLSTALGSLRVSHGIDVELTFRAVPFTPMAELYLINDTEALFSYCIVSYREEEFGGTLHEFSDAFTELTLQRRFSSEGKEETDGIFVQQSNLWFTSIWETVSSELEYYI
jgi:hypothetical protein